MKNTIVLCVSIFVFAITSILFNNNEYYHIRQIRIDEGVRYIKEPMPEDFYDVGDKDCVKITHYDFTKGLIAGAGTALILSLCFVLIYKKDL